jgi:predicted lipoprotein with Yx(FWY)xxD motif
MQSKIQLAGAIAAALVAVGCGSSNTTSQASPSPIASPSVAASGTTIAVATNAKLGQILVDGKGITLYLFVKDTGPISTCYDACAQIWPPVLTTGTPQAGNGVAAELLGTTTRNDGKLEVTYNHHPLYYIVQDKKAGDATGQGVDGFGGLWWVLAPSGAPITTK